MTNLKNSLKNRRFFKSHFGFESKVHQRPAMQKKTPHHLSMLCPDHKSVCVRERNVVSVLMHIINV